MTLSPPSEPGVGVAPGKAILLGEHFVVHGAPALAVPVRGREVEVRVSPGPGEWRVQGNALAYVRTMVEHLGLDPDGLALTVGGTLPIGSGLGSSAALAVALVRALGVRDTEEVRRLAHGLERLAHGRPSGVDDAVAAYGRPVWFEGGVVTPIEAPAALPLWIATTPPGPSTKVAVASVARWGEAHPERFGRLLDASRADTERGRELLAAGAWERLGALLDDAHVRLSEVGVSTPTLDAVCAAAREAGAWGAKLTGAGMGGAALVLAPNDLDLRAALVQAGAQEVFAA
ncbi:MAG: mevalonate kinase [Deltaproteobacteria bacterium]|nr:MAG: mevalonate kinase [Deltaproteobacteria bacterium]